MKVFFILLVAVLFSKIYAQDSILPKYFYCNDKCEFIKLKKDGTYKFETSGKIGGTKKMSERYDSKGNVIYVKAFNWYYTGNSENFIYYFEYDSINRITSIARKSVKSFLPFVYSWSWKAEINHENQTVDVYSPKGSRLVYDGTKKLVDTPTIHNVMVWSYEDAKL